MRRTIETASPEETVGVGAALGRSLRGGDVIGLGGDLGAGKTQLVRGIAAGLDLSPDVIYSPTFTLVAEHEGRVRLNHIDLFRLGDHEARSDEEEIGLGEYLAPAGVTVIEWHRRLAGPPFRWTLEIEIEVHEGERRALVLTGEGRRAEEILRALEQAWR